MSGLPSASGLFREEATKERGPVECLGLTFENSEARRAYFLDKLRVGLEELHAKLGGVPFTSVDDAFNRMKSIENWPMGDDASLRELAQRMRQGEAGKDLLQHWKDEVGFPHGKIEDILTLSDPPYYTACPNPFIGEFIRNYGKPYDPDKPYSREPFAVDVSEGKTDPIYKAHSYHTKVPHLAIVPSILHYTEPGDVVLDGFCGSGMTGVAAQWCGCAPEEYRRKVEADFEKQGLAKPVWGARRVMLNDLSPAATFIAANYNLPFDVREFARAGKQILEEVEREIGWMYRTLRAESPEQWAEKLRACKTVDEIRSLLSPQSPALGTIEYTVWSEVFTCPDCAGEVVFLDEALDEETKRVKETFPCPHCGSVLSKQRMDRCYETRFGPALETTIRVPKRRPSLISYKVGARRYEKTPDEFDLKLLERIAPISVPPEIPITEIPPMHMTHERARMDKAGVTHIHHFFLPRAAYALAVLWRKANAYPDARVRHMLLFFAEQGFWTTSVCNSYRPTGFSQVSQYMKGIYYVPSQHSELSPWYVHEGKLNRLMKAFSNQYATYGETVISTSSTTCLGLDSDCIDYIFTDPPFGENIYYADLNFLAESWHRVITNAAPEAIVDKFKKKGLPEYQHLIQRCFEEYYRVLKPGRWMTVVFHNSRNAVWNAIQEAMQYAGFVVADVRTLDKQQGSYRQVTSTAVKQDLVISCYKPNGGLEQRFRLTAGTEEGVWDFVRTHLKKLPVFVTRDGKAEVIAERVNYLLFDRMVAFHVRRGVTVPLTAAEFYQGLAKRFSERDGMYFLPDQVAEYDRKRMTVKEILQLSLFVTDESSAIQWLKQQLTKKPQSFQELHPQFMREIGGWQKHEKTLELKELLEQNFLMYDGKGPISPQLISWMKQSDKLRKIMQDEMAAGQATEDMVGLATQNPELLAAARDRWYLPDPNKAGDLEKLRERALLHEFEEYKASPQRRLRVFRMEAVRAGFKKAWQEKDYGTIIEVARKIPESILQEDAKLLMWFDQAVTRMGG